MDGGQIVKGGQTPFEIAHRGHQRRQQRPACVGGQKVGDAVIAEHGIARRGGLGDTVGDDEQLVVGFQLNAGRLVAEVIVHQAKGQAAAACQTPDRAIGLKMKVVAFDPFLSVERARQLGVEKVELPELLKRADFITLHTPMTEKTRNILDATSIAKCKAGVRIINCARGGLVDEQALADALKSGQVAGAAFDVFVEEPAKTNVLFGLPNMICTPHLGAATNEAQENVALQVAEQMSDYLLTGAITNAINAPNITAEEAPKLKPWVRLAEQLGLFAGQLTEKSIKSIRIEYAGDVAELNKKPLTAAALTGVLRPLLADINMVSALIAAKERGIMVEETTRGQDGAFESYVRLTVVTDEYDRAIAGTVFSDGRPRIIQVRDINMEFELTSHMLFVRNTDKPGFIGKFGNLMGEAGLNIATFNLGRDKPGGDAICVVATDEVVSDEVLAKVRALPHVVRAHRLEF